MSVNLPYLKAINHSLIDSYMHETAVSLYQNFAQKFIHSFISRECRKDNNNSEQTVGQDSKATRTDALITARSN